MKKYLFSVILLTLGLLCLNCSKDSTGNLSDSELLSAGWEEFSARDYGTARDYFAELAGRGALLADAYCGLGWSRLYLGSLALAIEDFEAALNENPSTVTRNDILAGMCFGADALGDPQACIEFGGNVAPGWQFRYRTSLSFSDITLVRAASYYALGDFAASLTEVRLLDASFSVNVNTVEGRAALAAKIETLRGSV
ncbi:MAG: hypothetical protein KDE62_17120 [Calditrichaeota bacterium]|nr:hypothetical protein [Calditrichota bacterium]